jgi:hypothetical protein
VPAQSGQVKGSAFPLAMTLEGVLRQIEED